MTIAHPTDPQAIAESYRESFEQMARARDDYRDAYDAAALSDAEGSDPAAIETAHDLAEAITGEQLKERTFNTLPDPDDLDPWPAAGDVLDVELHGHRACSVGGWTVDEVQFIVCTGGPHVEIVYEAARSTAEVRCYWSGQGAATITDPRALELLEAAADVMEVS